MINQLYVCQQCERTGYYYHHQLKHFSLSINNETGSPTRDPGPGDPGQLLAQ